MKVEQRRRLTDLFSRGEELEISDGQSIAKLWIRKLTPADAERAIAKAGAARSRIWSMQFEESPPDEYLAFKGQVDELAHDQLVIWATQGDMAMKRAVIEARVAFENEWTKDKYLDGLLEAAFDPDFQAKEAEFPDDVEVQRVRKELARYQAQCDVEVEKELNALQRSYGDWSEEKLRTHVLDSILKIQADTMWAVEYERCLVWLCTYDNDSRGERIFQARAEVDDLQTETLTAIIAAADRVNVSDAEGKGSPPNPTS